MEKLKIEQSPMEKNGMYLFMERVKDSTVKPVIEWIISENLKTEKKEYLTLIICSPGGSVVSGFALIDTMKGSSIPDNRSRSP